MKIFILSMLSLLLAVSNLCAQLDQAQRLNTYLGEDLAGKITPKAAVNDNGEMLIAWQDGRNARNQLFYQLLDENQNPVGANQNLTPETEIPEDEFNVIVLPGGNFLVVWSHGPRFQATIRYAIFAPNGNTVLPPTDLEIENSRNEAAFPNAVALDENRVLIAYAPDDFSMPTARARVVNTAGQSIGDAIVLDTLPDGDDFSNFSLAVAPNGNTLIAYQREISFRSTNVAAVVLDAELNVLAREKQINTVPEEADNPVAIDLNDGDFAIFWLDTREASLGEVYVRELSDDGQVLRRENNLGTSNGGTSSRYPYVVKFGNRFVVSTLNRLAGYQIVNQNYSLGPATNTTSSRPFPLVIDGEISYLTILDVRFGNTPTAGDLLVLNQGNTSTQINDDVNSASEAFRNIEVREDGSGLFLWQVSENEEIVTYAQRFDADLQLSGDPIRVITGSTSDFSIAFAPDGGFAISIVEFIDFRTFFRLQVYNAAGRRIRSQELGETGGTANLSENRGVEYNPGDNRYFYWQRVSVAGNTQLRVRPVSLTGSFSAAERTLFTRDNSFTFRWVERANGEFVVIFQQFADAGGNDLFAALIDDELRLVGDPFRVSATEGSLRSNSQRLVSGAGDTVWIAYQLDVNDAGPDGSDDPFAFRALTPANTLTEERLLPSEDEENFVNFRPEGLLYYQDRLIFLQGRQDDLLRVDIDVDDFSVNERIIVPELEFATGFQFFGHPEGWLTFFRDFRDLGRGLDLYGLLATDADADNFLTFTDCDDNSASVFPGAPEILNNDIDEDCDGRDSTSTTGTYFAELDASVRVFPNPAREVIHLSIDRAFPYHLKLIDPLGRIVREAENARRIDLVGLGAGLYVVEFRRLDRRQRAVFRVVIE